MCVEAAGSKPCREDKLFLSMLVRVHRVASSRLSLSNGRGEDRMQMILQHRFYNPTSSFRTPFVSPSQTVLSYSRMGRMKVRYICFRASQGRPAPLATLRYWILMWASHDKLDLNSEQFKRCSIHRCFVQKWLETVERKCCPLFWH